MAQQSSRVNLAVSLRDEGRGNHLTTSVGNPSFRSSPKLRTMAFSPQLRTNDELSKTHRHATLQPGGNSRNFSFTPGSPLQHWSRKAPPPGSSVFRTKKKPAANFSFHDAAGRQAAAFRPGRQRIRPPRKHTRAPSRAPPEFQEQAHDPGSYDHTHTHVRAGQGGCRTEAARNEPNKRRALSARFTRRSSPPNPSASEPASNNGAALATIRRAWPPGLWHDDARLTRSHAR